MSWQDQYQQANVAVPEEGYAGPPRIWWRNGKIETKSPGFFYTKAKDHPDGLASPWVESNRYLNDAGYEATALAFAVIGWRSEPFIKVEKNGKTSYRYLPQYVEGASIYTEYLVMVDGINYPCVLIVKGMAGKAMSEAGQEFEKAVLNAATHRQKRRVARWTFWMPMTGATDRRGPVFAKLKKGGVITPLVLNLPDIDEADMLETLFVGMDVLVKGAQVREEYAVWLKEKRAGQVNQAVTSPDIPEDDPTDYSY